MVPTSFQLLLLTHAVGSGNKATLRFKGDIISLLAMGWKFNIRIMIRARNSILYALLLDYWSRINMLMSRHPEKVD